MSLSSKYLLEHADKAKNGRGDDKSDYEAFGRAVAELILRTAASAEAVKDEKASEKFALPQISVTVQQNKPLLCVSVEVCTPLGCITTHVGV